MRFTNIKYKGNNMKIGIMGGTFNPIHYGHLILSEFVLDNLNLDYIIFIPTGNPPHKSKNDVIDCKVRLEMVNLAVKSNSRFKVSRIEVDKKGVNYTVDTLKELNDLYSDDELYFILGADSLLTLKYWKDYEKIVENINIIVVDRRKFEFEEVDREIERLNKLHQGNIKRLKFPFIEISSTYIRDRVKEGKSIKYLLPENVEDYILKNDLYR